MARQLNIQIPDGLSERLRAHSERTGVPQSVTLRRALVAALGGENPLPLEPPVVDGRVDALVANIPVEAKLLYRCRTSGCGYSAASPAAVCPDHGRKVGRAK